MTWFVGWYENGKYTPFGEAFDMGNTCSEAIENFEKDHDAITCGGTSDYSNGNGSLMRIMSACLYAYTRKRSDEDVIAAVHTVSGLTHNHLRSWIGCGLYYFCITAILDASGSLSERLQRGITNGFSFYGEDAANLAELHHYDRLKNISDFAKRPEKDIKSSGYVVDSLEAAAWSIVTTGSFKDALLKAVNLGDDIDTIGAIAGGLAGLYYGYENIPEEWLQAIQKRKWIEKLLDTFERGHSNNEREKSAET